MSEFSPLALSPRLMRTLYADAATWAPHENCGFLSVRGGHVDKFPCANRADRRDARGDCAETPITTYSFRIDDDDLLALHRHLDDPQRAVILYHSHVGVGAYLSTHDLAARPHLGPHARYLVVDIREGRGVGARLFSAGNSPFSRSRGAARGTFALHESHRYNGRGEALRLDGAPVDEPLPLLAYDGPLAAPSPVDPATPPCDPREPALDGAPPPRLRGRSERSG